MTTFSIKQQWINTDTEGFASATHARIQIHVGKRNITENRAIGGKRETSMEMPTYYLAEWIAENWWVLLYEPRKDDTADDTHYYARHSLVSAQGGFPLPNLTIVPLGRGIHLNCSPRISPFTKVKFVNEAFADVPLEQMEAQLSTFVGETVKRLAARQRLDTPLAQLWSAHQSLMPDERMLCALLGALGIAPGDASDEVVAATELMLTTLGQRPTRDFCLAATPGDMEASQPYLDAVARTLQKAPEAALDPLLKVDLPDENYGAPSWRRGRTAADRVRSFLKVGVQNANAADILFEKMSVDPAIHTTINGAPPFAGAVSRSDGRANIALLQADLAARRFSAARAAYLAWASEPHSQRLVTNAVTRDQQASRSFAAEMLIPQAYLLGLAGTKKTLHVEQLHEAARARKVMPDVAFKQATNAGIRIERH
jgi:hypothetical protein